MGCKSSTTQVNFRFLRKLVPLWIRLNTRVGESEFVRRALARIVLHYIRVKRSCFSIQLSTFLNIFCAAVATAQQVPLTRALDGLSKNDGMGLLFRAVHYLPIVSGTNFRRNLKFTCVILLMSDFRLVSECSRNNINGSFYNHAFIRPVWRDETCLRTIVKRT
jgi:hypothetical protein